MGKWGRKQERMGSKKVETIFLCVCSKEQRKGTVAGQTKDDLP